MAVTISGSGQVVKQIVSTTKTDVFTTSSTTYTNITGLSVSITPSSASNKILVLASINGGSLTSTARTILQLTRNGTAIGGGTAVGSRSSSIGALSVAGYQAGCVIIDYLDSPATTSTVTYQVQCLSQSGYTACINQTGEDHDIASQGRYSSTITVMELAYA